MMEAEDKTKVVDPQPPVGPERDRPVAGDEQSEPAASSSSLPSRRVTQPPDGELAPSRESGSGNQLDVLGLGTQRLLGRYEVLHRLGHGGMATVYLGRAVGAAGFERLVAVKVIHPHLASEPEFVEMFLDEARIAARIHHPNVVEVIDLGEEEDLLFMVMEYVEGETLASLLKCQRKHDERMPVAAALQIVADACKGLSAAHDLQDRDGKPLELVHRDVSPHNLLITMDGRVKVVDFGIMKAAGKRSTTLTGQLRGKVPYMSPEQARSLPVDRRTDVFAMGAVLWEMLAGERVFAAATESETLALVVRCEVPDLFERRDGLPEELRPILEKALASNPADRYDTADEMHRDVRAVLRQLEEEARDQLSDAMEHYFSARIAYVQAAARGQADDPRVARQRSETGAELGRTTPLGQGGGGSSSLRFTPSRAPLPSGTLSSSIAAAPARSWLLWVLLPLAGAAIGTAAMRVGADDAPPPQEATMAQAAEPTRAEPDAASERPTQRPATAEAKTVKWWFNTDPQGAVLIVDGTRHDTPTPTGLELARSDEPVLVRIEKAGFVAREVRLAPLAPENHTYKLEPVPAVAEGEDEEQEAAGKPKRTPRFSARPKKSNKEKAGAKSTQDAASDGSPTDDNKHAHGSDDERTFEDMPDFDAFKKDKAKKAPP